MSIVHRRVFFGKVGMAGRLVDYFKEGEKSMREGGFSLNSRILTDSDSGRCDRVAVEWEADDMGDLGKAFTSMMSQPGAQESFQQWEAGLHEMIHYSEAETWQVR